MLRAFRRVTCQHPTNTVPFGESLVRRAGTAKSRSRCSRFRLAERAQHVRGWDSRWLKACSDVATPRSISWSHTFLSHTRFDSQANGMP
jgi:hypothetical protein